MTISLLPRLLFTVLVMGAFIIAPLSMTDVSAQEPLPPPPNPESLELYLAPGECYNGSVEVSVPDLSAGEPGTVWIIRVLRPPFLEPGLLSWSMPDDIPVPTQGTPLTVAIPQQICVLSEAPPGVYELTFAFAVRTQSGSTIGLGKQHIVVNVGDIPPPSPPPLLDPVKITGGGQIDIPGPPQHHTHSFGFNIQTDKTGEVSVEVEYNDNHYGSASGKKNAPSPMQIKINDYALQSQAIMNPSGEIIGLEFDVPATVRILDPDTGEVNVWNDNIAKVKVVDNGEPGRGVDEFYLELISGPNAGYTSIGHILSKGNVQVHNK